jgi:site-specific DNA recombinase
MKTQAFTYFLYTRKSTDDDKRQVLSIEAQLREVREFAQAEGLNVVAEFIERQSAKIPGRPVFNEMVARIEKGEASGIIAWHPDRLARNSVDGGRIIFLLDSGKLVSLKFPRHWFENTPQGKLMLNNEFGFSKYYVDSLSENTKRGLREKVHRGEFPGPAPVGYLNDYRSKRIILDRERAPLVKQAFEMYASGNETLDTSRAFFAKNGIVSGNAKQVGRSFISRVLTNPFYYGHFRYAGEIYQGAHEPLISKILFDEVQAVLAKRARTSSETKFVPKVFLGLLHCADCGGAITAEIQKGHTYYRCTKKNRQFEWCTQPYVREEVLGDEISALLAPFCLSEDWAKEMLSRMKAEEQSVAQSSAAIVSQHRAELGQIQARLQRLLDSLLDGIVERETYVSEKAKLMSQKKTLEEQIAALEQGRNVWLEPFKKWINEAKNAGKTITSGALHEKKVLASKIFGSNLLLDRKKARGSASKPWSLLLENSSCSEVVRERGLEPPPLAGPDPKSGVSAISPLAPNGNAGAYKRKPRAAIASPSMQRQSEPGKIKPGVGVLPGFSEFLGDSFGFGSPALRPQALLQAEEWPAVLRQIFQRLSKNFLGLHRLLRFQQRCTERKFCGVMPIGRLHVRQFAFSFHCVAHLRHEFIVLSSGPGNFSREHRFSDGENFRAREIRVVHGLHGLAAA